MVSPSDILSAKILLVDDQEPNVTLLAVILTTAGYTAVTSTTNPREVCGLHRKNHYDLIVLDLQMPDMDGFDVMERLKEIEKDNYLPVLVITAQPDHKLRALQAGAKDFISKPFDLAEVLMRVHNMLEVRVLHEAVRSHGKVLESLALRDPLTGLANRRLLIERLWLALAHARRNNSHTAVIYLDLDGFKQINDTCGHGAGDLMLRQVADRLVAAVREEDTVARLGGDEIMIALWNVGSIDDAAIVAERAIAAVSSPSYDLDGCVVDMTASAGLAIYPGHGTDVDSVIKCADRALYLAKSEGKNTYRIAAASGSADPAARTPSR